MSETPASARRPVTPLTEIPKGRWGKPGSNQLGPHRSVADRFWEKVDKSGDCWLWTGYRNRYGYGVVAGRPRNLAAHRVAYELANGPIPVGLQVCHHCDNPPCVRPDHLFAGDNGDNQRDAVAKGRWHATHQRLLSGADRWPK